MQNDTEGPLSPDDLQPEARILIVADRTAKHTSLERLLRESGYEQLQSFTGADLDQLASARADLAILDIGDGRTDDFQALDSLCALQREQFLPILVACGTDELRTRLRGLDIGAFDILSKPLELSEAAFRLRNLLRVKQMFEAISLSKHNVEERFFERTAKLNDALSLLRRAEKELSRRLEESEARNQAKSEFVASMGHELRTPLNAILGFSETIRDQRFGPVGHPKYAQYAADMYEAGAHLLRIVEDLLDLSKAEAGKLDITLEKVDATEVVASSVRMLSGLADEAGVDLRVDFSRDFPTLRTDRHRFQQALINIVTNSVKFTPAGGVVTVRGRREPDSVAAVVIVSDTGIGIAKRDIPTALSPYGQIRSSQRRNTKGTGLGLPLTKRIVEALGAEFELTSTPGEGTVVTFRFPPDLVV